MSAMSLNGLDATADTSKNSAITQNVDIASAIKEAFATDNSLSPFVANIVVRVEGGIVKLGGSASSQKIKLSFETRAKTVPGVTKVINHIEVKNVMKSQE